MHVILSKQYKLEIISNNLKHKIYSNKIKKYNTQGDEAIWSASVF